MKLLSGLSAFPQLCCGAPSTSTYVRNVSNRDRELLQHTAEQENRPERPHFLKSILAKSWDTRGAPLPLSLYNLLPLWQAAPVAGNYSKHRYVLTVITGVTSSFHQNSSLTDKPVFKAGKDLSHLLTDQVEKTVLSTFCH